MPEPLAQNRKNLVFFSSPLVLFLIFFLAVRVLSLLTAINVLSYPEELLRGNIARQILAGAKTPLLEYQMDTYMGGSTLVGLLAALFFSLFGQSLFVLKLVPLLCFFAPAFILMFLFLKDLSGPRAAILAALVFIFPAPTFAQMSVIAMGFHSESILFSAGMLYFYERLRTERGPEIVSVAAFGFLSGLGLWFTPTVGLSLAACVLADLADRRSFSRFRNLVLLAFSFGIGYTPFILYNLAHRFEGLHYVLNGFMTRSRYDEGALSYALNFGQRLRDLILTTLPRAFGFRRLMGNPGESLALAYEIFSFIAWAGLTWDCLRRRKLKAALPVLLYPLLFVAAYAASSFPTGNQAYLGQSRYFVPLFFYMTVIAGLYGAHGGTFRKFVYGALILLGLAGYSVLIFRNDFGQVLRFKGYYFSFFEYMQQQKTKRMILPDLQKALLAPGEEFKSSTPLMRCYAISRIGERASYRHPLEKVKPLLQRLSEHDQACFYAGFTEQDPAKSLSYLDKSAMDLGEESRSLFCRRLARVLLNPPDDPDRKRVSAELPSFSERELKWIYQGLGEAVAVQFWSPELRGLEALGEFFDTPVPDKYREDFYRGIGWGIGSDLNCERDSLKNWFNELPSSAQRAAKEGFREVEEFYNVRNVCPS